MVEFSDRIKDLKGNAIREIFKLLSNPQIISFAGGFPAKDGIPKEELQQICTELLSSQDAGDILQYGATEGYKPLIKSAQAFIAGNGIVAKDDEMLIISGGQQGIDLSFKALLNKGDRILVENPTYLAVLHILKTYEAEAYGVDADENGLIISDLEEKVKKYSPKIVYVVPNFSNPTGKTLSKDRRIKLLELAEKYDFLIIEDDPYGEIRFDGEKIPSIKSLDKSGRVIYLTSFSKIIAPGLRTGVAVGSAEIIRKLTIGKQASDVHTSNLSQAIVDKYITKGLLKPHIVDLIAMYKAKKDAMYSALQKYMPKGIKFTNPQGGLFIFAEFEDTSINADEIFADVVEKTKCAYVPGSSFFADGTTFNTFRLNYSNASIAQIETGVKALGEYFTKLLEEKNG